MHELVPFIIACIGTYLAALVLFCISFALVLARIIELNSVWSHSSSLVTVLWLIGSFFGSYYCFWLLYLCDKQSSIPSLPSSVSLSLSLSLFLRASSQLPTLFIAQSRPSPVARQLFPAAWSSSSLFVNSTSLYLCSLVRHAPRVRVQRFGFEQLHKTNTVALNGAVGLFTLSPFIRRATCKERRGEGRNRGTGRQKSPSDRLSCSVAFISSRRFSSWGSRSFGVRRYHMRDFRIQARSDRGLGYKPHLDLSVWISSLFLISTIRQEGDVVYE